MIGGKRRWPDPTRAHGAWIYLGCSIIAGILAAPPSGHLEALLVAAAFVGMFWGASGFAIAPRTGWIRRMLLGGSGAATALGLAWTSGASPTALSWLALVAVPAGLAARLTLREGVQSPPTLASAVVVLALAAPTSAAAGGTSSATSLMLFGGLAPFFAWRAWRVRVLLERNPSLGRRAIRARGLRETLFAASWTALILAGIRWAA